MTSKTLTSGIAAAALIGAIGFAYAQTSDSSAAPAEPTPTTPATMPDAAPAQQPSGTAASTPAPADLPAQADRN